MTASPTPVALEAIWPGRLWSLADMLTKNARYFMDLGAEFHDLMVLYYAAEGDEPIRITAANELGDIQAHFEKVWSLCQELKLPTSYALIGTRLDYAKLPRTLEAFLMLRDAVYSELKDKFFAYIPSDRLGYIDGQRIASKQVDDAFPSAYYEIQRAANCYALEEPVASVFHSMRAAEIGLRALAQGLGVVFPKPIEEMDWQPILNGIHGKILEIENKSPVQNPAKNEDAAFFSEAAAQFRFFKNAWRNKVNHVRANYTDIEAKKILETVISLFETLSTRLMEL